MFDINGTDVALSCKRALLYKCFTKELHIMEHKPETHQPLLPRKRKGNEYLKHPDSKA